MDGSEEKRQWGPDPAFHLSRATFHLDMFSACLDFLSSTMGHVLGRNTTTSDVPVHIGRADVTQGPESTGAVEVLLEACRSRDESTGPAVNAAVLAN